AALRLRLVTRTVRVWRCSWAPRRDGVLCQHQKGRTPGMSTSATPTTRTKVLLVDDHDLIRKGLRHAFERDRQFEVVGEAAPAAEVVAAARHAASAPSAFTAADLAEAMKRRLAPTGPQLSPREGQVLRLLADGMSVAGIAKQLFVSESTAKTHISKLYEKLGAANRAQALMTALRLGLLEAPDAPKF